MDEALYWMWLAGALGLDTSYTGALLEKYHTARELYEAMRYQDISLDFTRAALRRLGESQPADYEGQLLACAAGGITVLTPEDTAYPERLRALPDLPLVLYVTGSCLCLNGARYAGMVGTRRPTAYGVQACRALSRTLADNGVIIVSGLADGLDGEGQRAAVESGAPTIGFLGTAIDHTYPAGNAGLRRRIEGEVGGAVVSEYPPGCRLDRKATFLARNRLIAGLSEALCVAEARTRSGTMNTVGHAKRYGRPVFAVPGSIFSPVSEGTNTLLQKGEAQLLLRAEDVLEALQVGKAPAPPPALFKVAAEPLTPEAQAVLAVLGPTPKAVAEICAAAALPAGAVLAALTELEFSGAAVAAAGRRYALA
ncbi:MAG: DNA-processing protein DprA [Gemmiger sp.]|nr:DNA-processing protein DprA [Gemmiger sp.]